MTRLPRGGLAPLGLAHRARADPAAPDGVASTCHAVSPLESERGWPGQSAGLEQQTERDDAREPDQPDADRDAVEVALGDRGSTEAARDPATEHVGEPAAPALVEQDQQDQQQAGEDEQDGEE